MQFGMWTMADAASYTTISFLFLRQLSMKSNRGLSWLRAQRQETKPSTTRHCPAVHGASMTADPASVSSSSLLAILISMQ